MENLKTNYERRPSTAPILNFYSCQECFHYTIDNIDIYSIVIFELLTLKGRNLSNGSWGRGRYHVFRFTFFLIFFYFYGLKMLLIFFCNFELGKIPGIEMVKRAEGGYFFCPDTCKSFCCFLVGTFSFIDLSYTYWI